ncbi:thiamine diphosphokinase [Agrobacterium tumefaciens]|uniref:thiamine diphosphokinase n=1 Tax=Agrobacterium tumefaciens TaxID=358 RepID=UPI00287D1126|nr:thiamine diphosphokinase [Agrobacterium tumefaciens]MDS7598139.1 thiamine diphosphokinase [Agrobacterium tumefaciens]
METQRFTILLGGDVTVTDRLKSAVSGTRVIAADSGMRHASALGLSPELWVGDFDSAEPGLLDQWPKVERQPYPAAKAVTDGEIAVSEAINRGARSLVLAGALGGERSDHALQHFLYAVALTERGFEVVLTSGEEEAYPLLPGVLDIDLPESALFSVAGISALKGLTITNVRYPLEDFALAFGSSRTISNVANGGLAHFSLQSGKAIVLARPYDLTGA